MTARWWPDPDPWTDARLLDELDQVRARHPGWDMHLSDPGHRAWAEHDGITVRADSPRMLDTLLSFREDLTHHLGGAA